MNIYKCPGCGFDLRFTADIHAHNIRCGTDGERAYPKFERSPDPWKNPRYQGWVFAAGDAEAAIR